MTSARTIARPLTQCPYCDHVSPEDSKFCNECGAALHLKPCPHCGSLNDVTQTEVCARCHGSLSEDTAVAANDSVIAADQPPVELPPASALPPPRRLLPAAAALALGALAVAAYFGQEGQQDSLQTAPPTAAQTAQPQALPAPGPPSPVASAAAPIAKQADPEPVTAATAQAEPPKPQARPAQRAPRPVPAPLAAGNPDIEPKTPPLGPCTAAVAALGLCSNSKADSSANNTDTRRP